MSTIGSIYGTYKVGKFWLVATAISLGSGLLLPNWLRDIGTSTTPENSLLLALLIALSLFGLCLFPFAVWQHVARKRFFHWLEGQWTTLETGATHPDGYTVTLDTPLVRYQVVFSALFTTVSFASKPYVLQDRSAGFAQASFTLFSFVFGWWFLGPEGIVETAKAIVGNLRSSEVFTLRQLLANEA